MSLLSWLSANYVELTAAVLGLVGIAFQIKQNHWYWLTSILMVLLYIYVFFTAKFYADMCFQVYYLVVSIYGWWYWLKHKTENNSKQLVVNTLKFKEILLYILVTALLLVGIYFVLVNFTDSPVPFGDAFTTALSITATWLLARKYIENWLFWIIVDGVSACLYIYKGLYPTFILFVVLTMLAAVGYIHWRRAKFATNKSFGK